MSQWIPVTDRESGKTYFYNPVTMQTSWDRPAGAVVPPPPPPQPQPQPQPPASVPKSRWQEAIDPSTGRVYYLDHATHTTTWTRPVGERIDPPSVAGPPRQPVVVPAAAVPAPMPGAPYGAYYPQPQGRSAAPAGAPRVPGAMYPQYGAPQPVPPPPQQQAVPYGCAAPVPAAAVAPAAAATAAVGPAGAGFVPISAVSDLPLSTTRPQWQSPLAQDAAACPECGFQYTMFKRRKECKCCGRGFCEACTSKRAVVSSEGPKPAVVCNTCHAHLARGEARCVGRVVPYLAAADAAMHTRALRELVELTATAGYTAADLFAVAVPRELRPFFGAAPEQASLAAQVLVFCCAYPRCVEYVAAPEYTHDVVAYAQRTIETNPWAARLLAALAGADGSAAARASLHKCHVLPVLQKGLTSGNPDVVRECARAARALCLGDSAGRDPDDEPLFMFALGPLVDSADPVVRANVLGAVRGLVVHEPNRTAFISDDGIPRLLRALKAGGEPEQTDIAAVLTVIAAAEESVDALVPCVPALFEVVDSSGSSGSGSGASPQVQRAILQVLVKLCTAASAPARAKASEAIVLGHCASLARLLAVPDAETRVQTLAVTSAVLQPDPRLAATMFLESGVVAALAALVRAHDAAAPLAIECLAMSAASNKSVGEEIAEPAFCNVVVELAAARNRQVATALWALTKNAEIATLCAAHPNTLPTVMGLLASGDRDLARAACFTAAQLCVVRGFADALLRNQILQHVSAILTSGGSSSSSSIGTSSGSSSNEDLQVAALAVVAALASDPVAADQVAGTPAVMQALPALLRGAPALCYHACTAAGSLSAASDRFRVAFVQAGGLPAAVTATASSDPHIRERAAAVLAVFAGKGEADRAELHRAGGVPALLELLFARDDATRLCALDALRAYARANTPRDVADICAAGGVVSLTGLLSSDTPPRVAAAAADTLRLFVEGSAPCRASAFDAGVLPIMVKVLARGDGDGDGDGDAHTAATALAVVDALLDVPGAADQFCADGLVLLPRLLADARTKDRAVHIITRLSAASPAALETYVDMSGMGVLVELLTATDSSTSSSSSSGTSGSGTSDSSSGNSDMQSRAAELFARYAALPERRQALLAADCMPAVCRVLAQTANAPARTNAARGLAAMCADPAAQAAIAGSGALACLVALVHDPSAELRQYVAAVLARLAANPALLPQLAAPDTVRALARALAQARDSQVAPSILVFLRTVLSTTTTTTTSSSSDSSSSSVPADAKTGAEADVGADAHTDAHADADALAAIVQDECLPAVLDVQLFDAENTGYAVDLLAELAARRPACAPVLLDPAHFKALTLLFALVQPGGPLCEPTLGVLGVLARADPDSLAEAAEAAGCRTEPFVAIAAGPAPAAAHALAVVAALARRSAARQHLAQGTLPDTLLALLAPDAEAAAEAAAAEARDAALALVAELAASEAFRAVVCAGPERWLACLAHSVAAPASPAQAMHAAHALLRLSVCRAVRARVAGAEGTALVDALVARAAADDAECAALALDVLAAYGVLPRTLLADVARRALADPAGPVLAAALRAVTAQGTDGILSVFARPLPASEAVPVAVPEAASEETESAESAEKEQQQQQQQPPEEPEVDEDLVALLAACVAQLMQRTRDDGAALLGTLRDALGVLVVLCRDDRARGVVRTGLSPDALAAFAAQCRALHADALRLADLLGSV